MSEYMGTTADNLVIKYYINYFINYYVLHQINNK
jgi:hypothetical protein